MCFTLILAFLQCSVLHRSLANSRALLGDRREREQQQAPRCVCTVGLASSSRDILTTSEVSQLFQGINDGSGSPYLTFTAQAACFVVVVFYLPSYLGKASDISLLLPLSACCRAHGRHSHSCLPPSELSLRALHLWMHHRLEAAPPREFPEAPPATPWHPLAPSYLLRCGLSLAFVVSLFSSSSSRADLSRFPLFQ